jgi:methionyl-tRNA formyltransferase
MGTPDFAVPCFESLRAAGQEIIAVYSQPPRPAGRGHKLQSSPVQQWAERHGIPVYVPTSLKSAEIQEQFRTHRADAAIVAAYGLLLPPAILAAFPLGCLNVHPSPLPRWRGAAPIPRCIMAGDSHTAMMIMQMAAGLDTGDILWQQPIPIARSTTAGMLHDALAQMAGSAVLETLRGLREGSITPQPQASEGILYAQKLTKEDTRIDWQQPAQVIYQQILGLNPAPLAAFEYQGERIKVWDAVVTEQSALSPAGTVLDNALTIACGSGTLRPTQVQRAGKRPMPTDEMLRGFAIPIGTRLP